MLRSHVLGPFKQGLQARLGGQPRQRRYAWLGEEPASAATRGAEPASGDRGRDPSLLNQAAYRLTRHTNLPYLLLFLDRLPTTGTQKVQKSQIFAAGEDPRTRTAIVDLRGRKRR